MEPTFTDHELMRKLICAYNLRKLLQREGSGHKNALHRGVGVGLVDGEFALCIKTLVESGSCTVTKGDRGISAVLTFNDAFKSATPIDPIEVIADAMSDHPATIKPEAK
jgi:hypothetical protein